MLYEDITSAPVRLLIYRQNKGSNNPVFHLISYVKKKKNEVKTKSFWKSLISDD